MQLTVDVDCTGMAVDAAETIQSQNSLEKMLAHQLAAGHKLAMTLQKKHWITLANRNVNRLIKTVSML